jgi:hypothetical protein
MDLVKARHARALKGAQRAGVTAPALYAPGCRRVAARMRPVVTAAPEGLWANMPINADATKLIGKTPMVCLTMC